MTKEYMFLVYRWVKSFQNSGSIFNQKIQQTWKVLDEAVFGNGLTHLEYFADWNLDNGRTSSGKLEYWA